MTPDSAPPRLLVVDDLEDNRTLLRRRFTRLGYEVLEAEDGETALAMASSRAFDLVLLDVMMPGIDGLEVLRRLRQTQSEAALPVIMVTARTASEDVVEALQAGANDYITKPVDMEVAAARVQMQLRRKFADDRSRATRQELEQTLQGLAEAVEQAQNRSAVLADVGADERGPMVGLLSVARVLTRVCAAPELNRMVQEIDHARVLLDGLIVDAARAGGADRRRARPSAAIKVLVADADAGRRGAAAAVFAEAGVAVHVVEAASAAALLTAASRSVFDLVVVGAERADLLGCVAELRRAEAEDGQRRRPIVAVCEDLDAGARALQAGCDLTAPVPLTRADLLTALARALRRESEDLTAVA
jgi:DNA-binding response OmpR family regulator